MLAYYTSREAGGILVKVPKMDGRDGPIRHGGHDLRFFRRYGMLVRREERGRRPMARRNGRNTKGRIISAAWKLFYEQGYEDTTVEDIVFGSETSKGSFYHYFDGKDALLGTLADVFDEKYQELMQVMDPSMDAMEKLIYLNHELFATIEGGVSMDLLARLLATQLLARGEKHLLDRDRIYFKLLRRIVTEGQRAGQLRADRTVNDIVKAYALWERALMYDWCLCGGDYSLVDYTDVMTPMFLESYRAGRSGGS